MSRFWCGIAIFVLGGVLGTGFGVALGFFIFPYVFPPPAAAEQLADVERSNLVASGMFIHANPFDPKDYQSVIIWCERFGVLISPADLTMTVAAR
jgi:hypothetical protein